ncbi:MAG: isochorismate synthase [Flavobacterium sp.]
MQINSKIKLSEKDFFKTIESKIDLAQNPFVIYKKPNENQLIGIFQLNEMLHEWQSDVSSFVVAPFENQQVFAIPLDESEIFFADFEPKEMNLFSDKSNDFSTDDKFQFEKLVSNGIDFMKQNDFPKVVLSRKQEVEIDNISMLNCFENALNLYPTAFNFLLFHPKFGFWMGATPEQLIRIKNGVFETVSLAGTQVFSESITWQTKEIEEQALVTEYIQEIVGKFSENMQVSEPQTVQAGHLAHLKTYFKGNLNPEASLQELILNLHPTPAVCGLPKEAALQFILKNENYNRSLYTGFLGEWQFKSESTDSNTDLFVNLRCMEFLKNKAFIYVGCGVTKESQPALEFMETVQKSKTMLRIINQ